ncbi:hypothetical protein [Pseudomonas oryzihabitans]|uniref:Uncharacterized protein n=1 Tax=Pseudomonas oryzihabitans TaxID=47885 RepID=A0A2Z5AAE3_9PSED|nr:hypothetical protein [Pseudomonas oryzihabitans]AXA67795.1 hypothetical protein CE139_18930 [Pseudomonas oryzihabitans]
MRPVLHRRGLRPRQGAGETKNIPGRFACGLVADPYRFLPPERLAPWYAIDQLAPGAQGEQVLRAHFAGLLGTGLGSDGDDEAIQAFQGEATANLQWPLL